MMRSFSDKNFICIALLLAYISKIASDIVKVLLSFLLLLPDLFLNINLIIIKRCTLLLYLLSVIIFLEGWCSTLSLLSISSYF